MTTLIGMVEPRQARSRESLARVLDAAVDLLVERGDDSLTIAEVSARSRVSVGSIYARFDGKNAIVRAVQQREMDRIDAQTARAFDDAVRAERGLEANVRSLVAARVTLLAEEAPILSALMRSAHHDPSIVARGRESALLAQRCFVAALTRAVAQLGSPPSAARVEWCDELVHSLASRHLGLGIGVHFEPDRSFSVPELIDELTSTVLALLPDAGTPG
jgi:AcrR family transcriptional regulator